MKTTCRWNYPPWINTCPPKPASHPWAGLKGGSIQERRLRYDYELSTMPGWAGSSWYWYRYMDPNNDNAFASKEAINYWQNVDLYIGGTEHATGHLLYSRFWNKFLYDRGYVPQDEPFKKLINQGMIQGRSNFVYRVKGNRAGGNCSDFCVAQINSMVRKLHRFMSMLISLRMMYWTSDAFRKSRPDLTENGSGLTSRVHYGAGWPLSGGCRSRKNVEVEVQRRESG